MTIIIAKHRLNEKRNYNTFHIKWFHHKNTFFIFSTIGNFDYIRSKVIEILKDIIGHRVNLLKVTAFIKLGLQCMSIIECGRYKTKEV